jgi:hypothetical protein
MTNERTSLSGGIVDLDHVSHLVEAYRSLRDEIKATISAFANRNIEGGLLVLGIASDGTVLEVSNSDPGMPLVIGAPRPGAVGSRPNEYISPAVAAGAFDAWLRQRIESLSSGRDGLVVRLDDGTLVMWGSSDDAVMKADDLEGILQWSEDNHAALRSIDVSAPHTPAAKVAGGQVAPIPSP